MHFLGKRGTGYKDLPEATALQKTDTIHGSQIGLVTGALAGVVTGLVIYSLRDYIGLQIQIGIILPALVLGGLFGLITGCFLIGSSTPNSRLKRFQNSMEEGHILLMLDVAKERVDEITEIILKHHPEAEVYGQEPIIPAFP